MMSAKHFVMAAIGIVLSTPALSAQDLSRYREFHLGMTLTAVATQPAMDPSEAKVIHQRPAVIQELAWRPRPVREGSSVQTDPVQEIIFSFFNDELFRIVVTYDREKIEGLTDKDLIEGISTTYGAATTPAADVTSTPLSQTYGRDNGDRGIASWEDAQYSLNLIRSSYWPGLSLVLFSRRLDALARAAITEAIRLDKQEAPAREVELQKQIETNARVAEEEARRANKPTFRP